VALDYEQNTFVDRKEALEVNGVWSLILSASMILPLGGEKVREVKVDI
jgi:hypothetical protein